MKKLILAVVMGASALSMAAPAQAQIQATKEQILFYTSEWTGERFPSEVS